MLHVIQLPGSFSRMNLFRAESLFAVPSVSLITTSELSYLVQCISVDVYL